MTTRARAEFHECRRQKLGDYPAPLYAALLLSFVALLPGCGGSLTSQLHRNDPQTASTKAMELYDKNTDAKLSADELQASPSLAAGLRRLDGNRDGALSAEEIQARCEELDRWAKYIALETTVVARGRPLVGAEVTLIPEPFMGNGYPTYSGMTEEGGVCRLVPTGPELPGTPVGFYTARIVHKGQNIDTVRGVEIAEDTTSNRLLISL